MGDFWAWDVLKKLFEINGVPVFHFSNSIPPLAQLSNFAEVGRVFFACLCGTGAHRSPPIIALLCFSIIYYSLLVYININIRQNKQNKPAADSPSGVTLLIPYAVPENSPRKV